MIIYWNTYIGASASPHVYIGLGAISLRMGSPQALFEYTEIAHLVSMELTESLITLEV